MELNSKYKKIEKIGEGAYGIVYKSLDLETNNIVAVKIIRLEHCTDGIPPTTIREISNLKQLEHPNIVSLLDIEFEDDKIQLVFEYVETDLKRFLGSKPRLTYEAILKICYQLFSCLNFLHSSKIIHRDLKPANILIDSNYNIKIADFGLSKSLPELSEKRALTQEVVTMWYRSPEILLGDSYDTGVDIFAAGCIICELILGRPLFQGDSEIDQIFKIFQLLGTPTEKEWEGVSKLPYYNKKYNN